MHRQTIQAYAEEVQVPYLLHFTRATNLPSIMTHGLYPIAHADQVGVVPDINDLYRFDGHRNSTSLSIGFPNSSMFYKYRMNNSEVDWVVLGLDPSILWVKKCAFCRHNAADGRISTQTLENLMTPQAFTGMYDEIDGQPSRKEQKLKTFDPTDVQAEVLVFDVIEPLHFIGVIFEKANVRDTYLRYLGEKKSFIHANNKGMFASRKYARQSSN